MVIDESQSELRHATSVIKDDSVCDLVGPGSGNLAGT